MTAPKPFTGWAEDELAYLNEQLTGLHQVFVGGPGLPMIDLDKVYTFEEAKQAKARFHPVHGSDHPKAVNVAMGLEVDFPQYWAGYTTTVGLVREALIDTTFAGSDDD